MKQAVSIFLFLTLFLTAGCAAAPSERSEPPAFVAPFSGILTLSDESGTVVADVCYTADGVLTLAVTAPADICGITLQYADGKGTMTLEKFESTPLKSDAAVVKLGTLLSQIEALIPVQDNENRVFETDAGRLTVNSAGMPLLFTADNGTLCGTFTGCTLSEYNKSSGGVTEP